MGAYSSDTRSLFVHFFVGRCKTNIFFLNSLHLIGIGLLYEQSYPDMLQQSVYFQLLSPMRISRYRKAIYETVEGETKKVTEQIYLHVDEIGKVSQEVLDHASNKGVTIIEDISQIAF